MPGDDILTATGWLPTDAVLASAGDPTRWRVLWLLQGGELSVGEIARQFEISRPAVSRHLAILRAAGLVQSTKRGQHVVYGLEPDVIGQLTAHLSRLAGRGPSPGPAFNDRARAAIERALADPAAEPIAYRVLRAVLADDGCEAARALAGAGLVASTLPAGPAPRPRPDDLPGEPLQAVLAGAVTQARTLGQRRAGTVALALAALASDGVAEALATSGFDLGDLEGGLRRQGADDHDCGDDLQGRLAGVEASLASALDAVRHLAADLN